MKRPEPTPESARALLARLKAKYITGPQAAKEKTA